MELLNLSWLEQQQKGQWDSDRLELQVLLDLKGTKVMLVQKEIRAILAISVRQVLRVQQERLELRELMVLPVQPDLPGLEEWVEGRGRVEQVDQQVQPVQQEVPE